MKIKIATLGCVLWLAAMPAISFAQNVQDERQVVFRFVNGKDMFYIPWNGNGAKLDSLCNMLVPSQLDPGSVKVDGYGNDRETVKARCNRVKSELILRRGLTEDHFLTTSRTGSFNGLNNVVVVTLPSHEVEEQPGQQVVTETEPEQKTEKEEPVAESGRQPDQQPPVAVETIEATSPQQPENSNVQSTSSGRWSIGLNAGVPFFWGDMLSMAADRTHVGFAVGVQGSFRISSLFSTTLSVDYAGGKLGPRGYAQEYLLAPDGMTWYVPQPEPLQRYADLYSKVSLVNVGLSLDMNVNRIFGKRAAQSRFTAWISPTVYGQFFSSDVCTKTDGSRYTDGTTKPDVLSLGLGGSLTLRCRVSRDLDLQLKNTAAWMTDNHFDAIRTPFGKAKDNAMWLIQAGAVWTFNKK